MKCQTEIKVEKACIIKNILYVLIKKEFRKTLIGNSKTNISYVEINGKRNIKTNGELVYLEEPAAFGGNLMMMIMNKLIYLIVFYFIFHNLLIGERHTEIMQLSMSFPSAHKEA